MKIQTYTARTMDQALVQVRSGIGKHAVVLHTRMVPRRGFLRRKPWVEVTAADGRDVAHARKAAAAKKKASATPRRAKSAAAAASVAPVAGPTAGDLIRRTYQAARAEMAPAVPAVTMAAPTVASTDREKQMTRELAAVRGLVEDVARHQRVAAASVTAPGLPDPLVEHYVELIGQEVAHELARELVLKAAPKGAEGDQKTDAASMNKSLRREIAAMLPAASQAASSSLVSRSPRDLTGGAGASKSGTRPHVIALVGPTGVGKTTTVAKLAATLKLKEGRRVGLITADTYRIAAVEQLRTYANLIELPLEVVANPQEMKAALGRMAHLDAVVIDTAGRSPRDTGRLKELAAFIAAAGPDETHLVLSSTGSERVLLDTAERFSAIKTDRLIFTKLDEAVSFGVLLNVARKVGRPLSYMTTGQEVPHQIEVCDADRLAGLVMGEKEAFS
ncbi:MAG: hypothetical protein V3V20_03640 [Algisphaera sp.]